jgi:dihydroorotase
MLNVMSKFFAMGMPLKEVIRASTTTPATMVKRPQLGQIGPGAEADIAILRLDKGQYGFTDVKSGKISGTRRLSCEMTLRAGRIAFDHNGRASVAWREANIEYPDK